MEIKFEYVASASKCSKSFTHFLKNTKRFDILTKEYIDIASKKLKG